MPALCWMYRRGWVVLALTDKLNSHPHKQYISTYNLVIPMLLLSGLNSINNILLIMITAHVSETDIKKKHNNDKLLYIVIYFYFALM